LLQATSYLYKIMHVRGGLIPVIRDWLQPPRTPPRVPWEPLAKVSGNGKVCGNPANIFFTSKFSYLFFATPPIKLKLGQQIRGGLLRANHLEQLLWWATQTHWAPVRSHLLHFLQQVHGVATPFTSHHNLSNFAEVKPFSWPSHFNFSSSNCIVQDHTMSTLRDALSSSKRPKTKFYFGHVKMVNMFFSSNNGPNQERPTNKIELWVSPVPTTN
jgi:hypothetical protein